jgi:DNA gyrase subunit A
MATNMPPHNLGEVVDATVHLIDHPDAEIKDLMKFVKKPNFPTNKIICDKKNITNTFKTGRGKVITRAKVAIESQKNGRENIIITEIPYQVNKSNLITAMAELVQDKKIEGISDIRDESDKDGIRVVIELKRDAEPQIVLNHLYKHTQLETTYGIINLALVNNSPKVLNLKQILWQGSGHKK